MDNIGELDLSSQVEQTGLMFSKVVGGSSSSAPREYEPLDVPHPVPSLADFILLFF